MLLKIPAAAAAPMVAAAEGEIANTFSLPTCSMPSCVNATSLKAKKVQPSDAPHTARLSIKKRAGERVSTEQIHFTPTFP